MKRFFALIVIVAGLALSGLWIVRDTGWTAVFSRSAIFIGFLPIPGVVFGFIFQVVPAAGGIILGSILWKK